MKSKSWLFISMMLGLQMEAERERTKKVIDEDFRSPDPCEQEPAEPSNKNRSGKSLKHWQRR